MNNQVINTEALLQQKNKEINHWTKSYSLGVVLQHLTALQRLCFAKCKLYEI
jgi:hypothetical protein